MKHFFDENAGRFSVGALVIAVISCLLGWGLVATKADLYRDFVTKEEYYKSQDKIELKLDYIIKRLDSLADKETH